MNTIILELRKDHHRMARILKLMRNALDPAEGDLDAEHAEIMKECIGYMSLYPDAVHHPREDVIFDQLADKDDASSVYIDQLRSEHKTLATQCHQLLDMIHALETGTILDRQEFLSLASEYIDLQIRHMRIEETSIFPLAEETLSISDWKQIIAETPTITDPLFDSGPTAHFQNLQSWIDKSGARS